MTPVFPVTGYIDVADEDGDGVILESDSGLSSRLEVQLPEGHTDFQKGEEIRVYFCVPPAELNGLKLVLTDNNGNDFYRSSSISSTIKAGTVIKFPATAVYDRLTIEADKSFVSTLDGDGVNLTVKLGDNVVTDNVSFFDEDGNPVDVQGGRFTPDVPGIYGIYASDGSYISGQITITAFAYAGGIPDTPTDPQPYSTAFKSRVLITEFTGTECGFCTEMKTLLKNTLEDETINDRTVLVECHTFNNNDPCYLQTGFYTFLGVRGYPDVTCDLYYKFNNYRASVSELTGLLNDLHDAKKDGAAGLAVNSILDGDQVITRVTVKSAEAGEYRVGAFLLEDGIYGEQTRATETWQNTHNHVIRYIDAQDYIGYPIGTVEAGKTADYVFVWDLNDIYDNGSPSWAQPFVRENLHLAVFVTTTAENTSGQEYWCVSNVVDCPIPGEAPFEYRIPDKLQQ